MLSTFIAVYFLKRPVIQTNLFCLKSLSSSTIVRMQIYADFRKFKLGFESSKINQKSNSYMLRAG